MVTSRCVQTPFKNTYPNKYEYIQHNKNLFVLDTGLERKTCAYLSMFNNTLRLKRANLFPSPYFFTTFYEVWSKYNK